MGRPGVSCADRGRHIGECSKALRYPTPAEGRCTCRTRASDANSSSSSSHRCRIRWARACDSALRLGKHHCRPDRRTRAQWMRGTWQRVCAAPHIGLVDPHAKGDRRDDGDERAIGPLTLRALARAGCEASVVVRNLPAARSAGALVEKYVDGAREALAVEPASRTGVRQGRNRALVARATRKTTALPGQTLSHCTTRTFTTELFSTDRAPPRTSGGSTQCRCHHRDGRSAPRYSARVCLAIPA